jgi:23S rRNA (adenine2503-C2)-methyltransferase
MSVPLTSGPSVPARGKGCPPTTIHDVEDVRSYFQQRRWDPYLLKRLRYLMYAEARSPERLLEELPHGCRDEFAREVAFHASELLERVDSRVDGATKLVYRTRDRRLFESVLMRSAGRRISLCVSSQIGCAAGCQFCATGQMGLSRNLSEAEILDQVYQANRQLAATGERVRNVVFMGMGEPFHNEETVCHAVEKLQRPDWFGLSPRRVLVSTVGIPPAMLRFARRFPLTGLALSLHSPHQAQREQLIPLARRYPLDQLRTALEEVQRLQRCPLMIEYLMLDGVNDADDDADALADFAEGLYAHLNLIPYNPISDQPGLRPTPRPRRDQFAARLRRRGFLVTIRYSLGSDIAAACGQLIQQESAVPTRRGTTSSRDGTPSTAVPPS